jgi:hypothetical protein
MKFFLMIACYLGGWCWLIEWMMPAVPGQF